MKTATDIRNAKNLIINNTASDAETVKFATEMFNCYLDRTNPPVNAQMVIGIVIALASSIALWAVLVLPVVIK